MIHKDNVFWWSVEYWREFYRDSNILIKVVFAVLPYFLALAMLALAFFVTYEFAVIRETPLLLPLTAVILTAIVCGQSATLVTVFAAMLAQDYLFFGKIYYIDLDSAYLPRFIIFLATGLIVNAAFERLRSAEAQIRHTALHDHLTGLPNRRLLEDRLEISLERAKRNNTNFALLFIDIDKLKEVNDRYGHNIGDVYIKEIATKIRLSIRAEDSIARHGGDEIIVLVDDISKPGDVRIVAEKILKNVNTPFLFQNKEFAMSCSIGVAVYPLHGQSFQELMLSADAALYKAKSSGRNRIEIYDLECPEQI